MKKNRIILIITILLLIVAVILIFRNSSTTLGGKESDFAVKDTAAITRIFIADKNNNEVLLSRTASGAWLIDEKHRAHPAKIKSFIKTLADLSVRAPVPIIARNTVITRMAAIAKKVEIYQMGYKINIFGFLMENFP